MNSLKKVVLDLCEEEIPEEQLFIENEKDGVDEKVQQRIKPSSLPAIFFIEKFLFLHFID
jgi:hypothetical protein